MQGGIFNLISFFIETILVDRAIVLNHSSKMATFSYNKENDQFATKEFINFFTLLDYLKNNGLIIEFNNEFLSPQPQDFLSNNLTKSDFNIINHTRKEGDSALIVTTFAITYPQTFYHKICELSSKQVQLNPSLEYFIKSSFVSIEEQALRQAKTQTYLSYSALGLSIVTLIISWLLQFQTNEKEIKLNDGQILMILEAVKNSKQDSVYQNTSRKINLNADNDSTTTPK